MLFAKSLLSSVSAVADYAAGHLAISGPAPGNLPKDKKRLLTLSHSFPPWGVGWAHLRLTDGYAFCTYHWYARCLACRQHLRPVDDYNAL